MLRITLKKSPIGHNPRNRATIKALGIKRINHTVEHEDSPTVRGMIHPIRDLLHVEEAEGSPAPRIEIAKDMKAVERSSPSEVPHKENA